jgi:hypothetical protein
MMVLLIANTCVGRLRCSGITVNTSGESRHRTVAVPRVTIADTEYAMAMDDSL